MVLTQIQVIDEIFAELRRAEAKFPGWPDDVVHGAAIVAEESGELVQASLDLFYNRGNREHVIKEAVQTAAMSLRFLLNFATRSETIHVDKNTVG